MFMNESGTWQKIHIPVKATVFCNFIINDLVITKYPFIDQYVELAREQGFRCRSAFILLETNDKFKLNSEGGREITPE